MEYPIEVALKRPVTVGETRIDKLIFDEPDLGTAIAVEEAGSAVEQRIALLTGMAGVDRAVLLKVKESDYREITRRVLDPYQAQVAAEQGADPGNGGAAE